MVPTGIRPLSGSELEQLMNMLLAAYSPTSLTMMLKHKLNKELAHITTVSPFSDFSYIVFQLLEKAEQEGWIYRLLAAVREDRSNRPDLVSFIQQLGVAPAKTPLDGSGLEKLIDESNAALDVLAWRTRLAEIEGRVCRIEIEGKAKGTGFLVGPDLVLTNWHVVKNLKDQPPAYKPVDVVLRFDYKRLEDGTELSMGKKYGLVTTNDDWLADHSLWSAVDLEADPKSGDPNPDELDYALLRVDGSPGDAPPGENVVPGSKAAPRGCIPIPDKAHNFVKKTPLFIVQHPQGAPLKLMLDTQAVIGLNGNQTRVRYRTNTDNGSSGSPVFDQNWNLVALHHSGDPASILPTYNEGIPINLVRDRLKAKGAL